MTEPVPLHSAEPWSGGYEGTGSWSIYDAGDECVASLEEPRDDDWSPFTAGNFRRIVACINACVGIPTELLEKVARRDLFTGRIDVEQAMKQAAAWFEAKRIDA